MTSELLIGVLSLAGTCIGSIAGIIASNKLVLYRLSQLEEKVAKHNNLVERMYSVESSCKSAHKRLDKMDKE